MGILFLLLIVLSCQGGKTKMSDYNKDIIIRFLRSEGEIRPVEELEQKLIFVESRIHPDLGEIREYQGDLGEFTVSSRGNVVSYWSPPRDSASEPLSPDGAAKLAHEFILRHQPDFARRNFVSILDEVEDSVWKGEWEEKPLPGEVSIYPSGISVEVNLWTHSVTHFFRTDLRFIRKTPPKISEAETRKKVLAEFEEAVIDKIKLMEMPIEGGRKAITVWFVIVLTPASTGLVPNNRAINADTGEPVPY